jgi:transposase-like protein
MKKLNADIHHIHLETSLRLLAVSFQQIVHPVLTEETEVLKLQIPRENRMNMHKNARLTPRGRERILRQMESGQTLEAVAEAVGVCPRTARKWVDRYRREGLAGLQDRSSRPHRLRRPTPQAVVEEIDGCVASTGRASRSPLRPASRQPPSAVFCVGWG